MRNVLASLLTATGLLLSQQQPDSAAPTPPAPVAVKKKSGVDRQRSSVRRQLGEFLETPEWFFWPKPLPVVAAQSPPPPAAAAPAEEPAAPAPDTTKK